eukprot:augustus_masked-scaffold_31-processed-gene-3.67-mRNA-1 protein AED:1.00 eAED:1.00 QI:0/0/0/0/1/1/2/0/312
MGSKQKIEELTSSKKEIQENTFVEVSSIEELVQRIKKKENSGDLIKLPDTPEEIRENLLRLYGTDLPTEQDRKNRTIEVAFENRQDLITPPPGKDTAGMSHSLNHETMNHHWSPKQGTHLFSCHIAVLKMNGIYKPRKFLPLQWKYWGNGLWKAFYWRFSNILATTFNRSDYLRDILLDPIQSRYICETFQQAIDHDTKLFNTFGHKIKNKHLLKFIFAPDLGLDDVMLTIQTWKNIWNPVVKEQVSRNLVTLTDDEYSHYIELTQAVKNNSSTDNRGRIRLDALKPDWEQLENDYKIDHPEARGQKKMRFN